MHSYIEVQNFTTKPRFCKIVFQRASKYFYLSHVEFFWFSLLWEFPDVILFGITRWKRGLVIKQESYSITHKQY